MIFRVGWTILQLSDRTIRKTKKSYRDVIFEKRGSVFFVTSIISTCTRILEIGNALAVRSEVQSMFDMIGMRSDFPMHTGCEVVNPRRVQ